MRNIQEKVQDRLEKLGIEAPRHTLKSSFTTIIFKVIDPVSEEILKEYTFNEHDFKELSYKDKAPYKTLSKYTTFDEKAYTKELKRQKKVKENYDKKYEEIKEVILKEENITKGQEQITSQIMSTISEYLSLEDMEDDEYIELEERLLNIIKYS